MTTMTKKAFPPKQHCCSPIEESCALHVCAMQCMYDTYMRTAAMFIVINIYNNNNNNNRRNSNHVNNQAEDLTRVMMNNKTAAAVAVFPCQRCNQPFQSYQARNAHAQFCLKAEDNAIAKTDSSSKNPLRKNIKTGEAIKEPTNNKRIAITKTDSSTSKNSFCKKSKTGEAIEEPTKTIKKKRITKKQIDACLKYFDEANFNRNKNLPTGGSDNNFVFLNFLKDNELTRDQVKTQLKNWKRRKYEYFGEVYEDDPVKVRETISSHLHDEPFVFLKNVIDKMVDTPTCKKDKSSVYALPASEHPYIKDILLDMAEGPFKNIFLDILEKYVDIGVEVFPQQAKNCDTADQTFYLKKQKMVEDQFGLFYTEIKVFDNVLNLDDTWDESKKERERRKMWKRLYKQIEEKMFTDWCHTSYTDELPPIVIVLSGNINTHSFEVLYYTAGCILKKIGLTKKKDTKSISIVVCNSNSLVNFSTAKANGLPFELTKVRLLRNRK